MCCLTSIFLFFSSRLAILIWWLVNPLRFTNGFQTSSVPFNFGIPAWLWTLAGAIFLPWTTLAYIFVYPGGITGYKWLILLIGLIIDLTSHGSSYHHRRRVPGLSRIMRFA
ncbi:MAG: hypothetical protein P4L50_18980 [Anaerolineaceae bacterium]|nr:hypothetical protein [Anaerolineaceae bacterium]